MIERNVWDRIRQGLLKWCASNPRLRNFFIFITLGIFFVVIKAAKKKEEEFKNTSKALGKESQDTSRTPEKSKGIVAKTPEKESQGTPRTPEKESQGTPRTPEKESQGTPRTPEKSKGIIAKTPEKSKGIVAKTPEQESQDTSRVFEEKKDPIIEIPEAYLVSPETILRAQTLGVTQEDVDRIANDLTEDPKVSAENAVKMFSQWMNFEIKGREYVKEYSVDRLDACDITVLKKDYKSMLILISVMLKQDEPSSSLGGVSNMELLKNEDLKQYNNEIDSFLVEISNMELSELKEECKPYLAFIEGLPTIMLKDIDIEDVIAIPFFLKIMSAQTKKEVVVIAKELCESKAELELYKEKFALYEAAVQKNPNDPDTSMIDSEFLSIVRMTKDEILQTWNNNIEGCGSLKGSVSELGFRSEAVNKIS